VFVHTLHFVVRLFSKTNSEYIRGVANLNKTILHISKSLMHGGEAPHIVYSGTLIFT